MRLKKWYYFIENYRHTILFTESDKPEAAKQKEASPCIPEVHEVMNTLMPIISLFLTIDNKKIYQ